MDRDDILKNIRRSAFKANNGRVLRTINILRTKYVRLRDVKYALPEIDEGEYLDCVNYLHESAYIELRDIESKTDCVTGLADHDYKDMEAKLSAAGIRLLAGGVKDDCVEV